MQRPALRTIASFLTIVCFATISFGIPCPQNNGEQPRWVTLRINSLVRAAYAAYQNEKSEASYARIVKQFDSAIRQCRLSQDSDFTDRYGNLIEYLRLLSLAQTGDHELGFEVTDKEYFAETAPYAAIPDFLLAPQFLKAVSRFEGLARAKAMLREMNAQRAPDDQLIFFSYSSRHLGTPDNRNSFRRLLIVLPGNKQKDIPEQWVQFGIADPGRPHSVRNISVVAIRPAANNTNNIYFKDYFRTYHRNGSISVKGRWELGEGDDNCVSCHKSGVLPIFPVAGSVSRNEMSFVDQVNQRFMNYLPARFDKYLDVTKFGPGLGSNRSDAQLSSAIKSHSARLRTCSACHEPQQLNPLNWPMDQTIISSFGKGGRMPEGAVLSGYERQQLYNQLVRDYFATDDSRPGVLKSWLMDSAEGR
ncbi:MAG TPA: hypothetical protein VE863_03470 [Pyrinomonadaceae bacterium]|jgi:hypothetical protein|nr:hypothetical protein [Pyrinomonadaceae bacterium]